MEVSKSTEEFKIKCIAKMGEEVGITYYYLWQEIAIIYLKWEEYNVLYGTKPSRIKLLNNTAPKFFKLVHDTLWENIILHITRLIDPAKSSGKMNLSLQRLSKITSDSELSNEIKKMCGDAIKAGKSCKDLRNKIIAHRDLNTALGNGDIKLEYNSRKEIKHILNLLVEILNTVSKYYLGSTTTFDLDNYGDSKNLLRIIHKGLKSEKIEWEKLEEGIIQDDFYITDL
jgi:hypothetical protein